MKHTLRTLYEKHGHILRYLIIGGLATGINIVSFYLFSNVLHLHYNVSNVLAQIPAIAFAFVGNKWIVFKTSTDGMKGLLQEAFRFVMSRLLTMLFSMVFMRVVVGLLGLVPDLGNLLNNIFMIVLNYVLSRLLVFRR